MSLSLWPLSSHLQSGAGDSCRAAVAIKAPGKVTPWRLIRSSVGEPQGQRTSHKNMGPRNLLSQTSRRLGRRHCPSLWAPPVLSTDWTLSPRLSPQGQKEKMLTSVHSSSPTTTRSTLPPPGKHLSIKGILYRKVLGTGVALLHPLLTSVIVIMHTESSFPTAWHHTQLLASPLVIRSLNPLLEAAWAVEMGGAGIG